MSFGAKQLADMKFSLPGIVAIAYVECRNLSPDITLRHCCGLPVAVYTTSVPVEHYGDASCEGESDFEKGGYFEKTKLEFRTTDEIPQNKALAFIVEDAQGEHYVIGAREKPFPMVEVTTSIDKDTNIKSVKVTFSAKKSLVPCVV